MVPPLSPTTALASANTITWAKVIGIDRVCTSRTLLAWPPMPRKTEPEQHVIGGEIEDEEDAVSRPADRRRDRRHANSTPNNAVRICSMKASQQPQSRPR